MMPVPSEKLTCRGRVNQHGRIKFMGDRSPKSTQKKSSQKQSKANSDAEKKKAALVGQQAAGKKK